ncbi:unnamed protein product [Caenorhabditis auriculariae]|uniref:Uncharacterized protein n=1 Tax=Caenorhabditis auriculariae TaxID=2777116 RepID=A0A8S1HUW7_9PELO|nr:unnamed protein product [Caenorhabditis auriculariae]
MQAVELALRVAAKTAMRDVGSCAKISLIVLDLLQFSILKLGTTVPTHIVSNRHRYRLESVDVGFENGPTVRLLRLKLLRTNSDVNSSLIDSPAVSPATLVDLAEKVAKINAGNSRAAPNHSGHYVFVNSEYYTAEAVSIEAESVVALPADATQGTGRPTNFSFVVASLSNGQTLNEYFTAEDIEIESAEGSRADVTQGAGRASHISSVVSSVSTDSYGPGSPLMASTPIDQSEAIPVIPAVLNFDSSLPWQRRRIVRTTFFHPDLSKSVSIKLDKAVSPFATRNNAGSLPIPPNSFVPREGDVVFRFPPNQLSAANTRSAASLKG